MDRKVRLGEIHPKTAFLKVEKAYEKLLAEKVLLERDLERREAAEAVDKAARSSNKRTRFPKGTLFDQKYQETHAAELAQRAEEEEQARKKKAAEARHRKKARASPLQE